MPIEFLPETMGSEPTFAVGRDQNPVLLPTLLHDIGCFQGREVRLLGRRTEDLSWAILDSRTIGCSPARWRNVSKLRRVHRGFDPGPSQTPLQGIQFRNRGQFY